MSDVISDGQYTNNGISLPLDTNATHNISLSPLFVNHVGDVIIWLDNRWTFVAASRGLSNDFFTSVSSDTGRAHRMYTSIGGTLPSASETRNFARSLRCLVSTANS